ncbi:MAG: hypothetical protein EZS28_032495, partial [Streblomastix strix]
MADRFQFRQTINDSQQTKEDKPNAGQMEKDNNVSSNGESEILGQFHRVTEFPTTIIQERQNPPEKAKLDQIMGSPVKRLECIGNSEYVTLDQATLATDASLSIWGATLKLQDPAQEFWFCGKWSLNWHLTSSNQRETAAILCALRRSIETDNSSAAYNINLGLAAVALVILVDQTLETADVNNLQLHALNIPGVTNRIPDSQSRLTTSADYSLHHEVFQEALQSLRTRPSIDMFANRMNRKLKRLPSLTLVSWAVGQDCMSLPWKGELLYLHPPLPMIQATLNKVREENVAALIVVPNWPSQSWWP